ncbi:trypsin-like peptidase domain-containing protein [Psychromarinibacter sp. C21-152]|uniref:Serine protease n=1 Tax=Psychromarinibacter sediminicola TaxID=3033385 RepID=A0AAE3TAQ9_9RHOB|nr:trypsin-like peptidase domain-containing protein [Psychromarinibacter sediminicola]MDF0603113.1 trypsin-like peptidase domain-containing protein [Psychromarinibacter sediminicola]
MRRRAVLSLLALVLAGPAPAQTSALERLTQRDDLFGFEAVGRLDVAQAGYCTAVLIAPDLVLTAAHCVMDRAGRRYATELRFRAGLRDGAAVAERGVLRTVVHPDYDIRARSTVTRVRHDVALVVLDRAIPAAVAAPFKVAAPSGPRAEVSVVSYALGRDDALSRQAVCHMQGMVEALFAFDCEVSFGSSGAPVFENGGRRGRIVSLISSGYRDDGQAVAFGPELPALVGRLKRQLASGEGVFPAEGFDARHLSVGDGNRGVFGEGNGTGAKFVRP